MIELKDVSADTLQKGVLEDGSGFTCVYCGERFEKGEVFPAEGRFFDAARAAQMHLETHNDRMERLFAAGEKNLSLTENQKDLLTRFAGGQSDAEIAKELGVTASTVRHQRFMLRERAKAAKLYLAVWSLAEEGKGKKKTSREDLLMPHEGATMVDERYVITEEEEQKILENVFYSLEPLRLKVFSKKEKKKIVILRRVAQQFEAGKEYTEPQVNDILREVWEDFVTLRRYLIEYGYLERTRNGSAYWKKG